MTTTVGKIEQLTHEKLPLPYTARLSPVRSADLVDIVVRLHPIGVIKG